MYDVGLTPIDWWTWPGANKRPHYVKSSSIARLSTILTFTSVWVYGTSSTKFLCVHTFSMRAPFYSLKPLNSFKTGYIYVLKNELLTEKKVFLSVIRIYRNLKGNLREVVEFWYVAKNFKTHTRKMVHPIELFLMPKSTQKAAIFTRPLTKLCTLDKSTLVMKVH